MDKIIPPENIPRSFKMTPDCLNNTYNKNLEKSFIEKCSEEDLTCAKGGHPLENPYMITRCQHVFCHSCLTQEVQQYESLKCPKCLTSIKENDIIFSLRDNTRLKRTWDSAYGSEIENPYIGYSGQDKKSIFGTRDFFDYETVSSDIYCGMNGYSAKGKHFKENVEARDGIDLYQCIVDGNTETSMGRLKGKLCVFKGQIEARDGVKLKNSKAPHVETSMGHAKIKGGSYGSIKARDGVRLENSKAQHVETSMGKAKIQGGSYGSIEARDGAILDTANADKVTSSMGKVYAKKGTLGQINARDGVNLSNVVVPKGITSSMGSVEVFGCKVGTIETSKTVKLDESLATSVTINTSRKNSDGIFEALLELNGNIEGDVKVVVKNNVFNCEDFKTGPFAFFGGRCKIGTFNGPLGYSRCETSINIGSIELQTKVSNTTIVNGARSSTYYDLTLDGASYPLSPEDIQLIHRWYREPLDISPDGRISNTYGKTIKIGSQVFGKEEPIYSESSHKGNQPKCVLKITGNGTIQGKVKFIDCEGKVSKDSTIAIMS